MRLFKVLPPSLLLLIGLILICYWPFFLFGKIPMPGDAVIGSYFPWLDYKWGFAVGVPVKNAMLTDVFSQLFLWKYLAISMWSDGQIPLWNPYSYSGHPLLANFQSSVFLPFNLWLLLPKFYGWGFYILSQSLLAGIGMYLLTGKLKANWQGQVVSGIVFTFSGLMTTWTQYGTDVYAAAFLVWSIYFLESYKEKHNLRYLIALSISQLLLYFSGHAQIAIYSLILIAIYTLVFINGVRKIIPVGLIIGLSLLMASIQLLPTYDLTKSSIRSYETREETSTFGLSPYYEAIRLVAPDFFGNPVTYNQWNTSNLSYHEQSKFIGILSLIFIIPFVFKRFRNKVINFWGLVLLGTLLLAIDNPLTRLLYSQPLPFLTYSSASRILFVTSLSAAILTGLGITKFLTDSTFTRFVKITTYVSVVTIAGICLALFLAKLNNPSLSENLSIGLRNLVIPLLIAGVFAIVVSIKLNKLILTCLLIGLIFFDLSRYFLKYNTFVSQDLIFPKTPITEYLNSDPDFFRIARADRELMPPNTWMHYKLSSIEGYDPLALKDYAKTFNVGVNGKSQTDNLSRYSELENYPSKYLDSLNVKYLLAVKRDADGSIPGSELNAKLKLSNYKIVFEDKNTVILENPQASERVYFVSQVLGLPGESDIFTKLEDKNFDPTLQAMYLAETPFSQILATGSAIISSYKPNEIIIQTESETRGFVVLADAYEKGWHLTIDNENSPLYKVNGALRGFWVERGVHQIEMSYHPDSFALGLRLSLAGFLILIIFILYSLRTKRF